MLLWVNPWHCYLLCSLSTFIILGSQFGISASSPVEPCIAETEQQMVNSCGPVRWLSEQGFLLPRLTPWVQSLELPHCGSFDLDMCAVACAGVCRYVSALACTCTQRHTQLVHILKIGSHHMYILGLDLQCSQHSLTLGFSFIGLLRARIYSVLPHPADPRGSF